MCSSVECCCLYISFVFFFKQKTAYEMRISDWSSDVCSSDLRLVAPQRGAHAPPPDPGRVGELVQPLLGPRGVGAGEHPHVLGELRAHRDEVDRKSVV